MRRASWYADPVLRSTNVGRWRETCDMVQWLWSDLCYRSQTSDLREDVQFRASILDAIYIYVYTYIFISPSQCHELDIFIFDFTQLLLPSLPLRKVWFVIEMRPLISLDSLDVLIEMSQFDGVFVVWDQTSCAKAGFLSKFRNVRVHGQHGKVLGKRKVSLWFDNCP